jgi:MFS family permease
MLRGIVWGALLMTTPACYNFAGIAINRFLLGMVEAVVTPGFVLMTGMWYTSEEQPLRLEAWYCTNGIATMFGGYVTNNYPHPPLPDYTGRKPKTNQR